MRNSILAGVLWFASAGIGFAQGVNTIQSFYNNSDFGILGVTRSNSHISSGIIRLDPDGVVSISGRRPRTFFLNTDTEGVAHAVSTEPTFAMVLMFVAFPNELMDNKPSLTIFRNSNWWRTGCPARARLCFDEMGTQSPPPLYDNADLEERLIHDRDLGDVAAIDHDLGIKFDGHPEGTNLESWNLRNFWSRRSRDEVICRVPNTFCSIKYYLMRFSPRPNPTGEQAVNFNADFWSAKAASIYVAAARNGDDFFNHYTLKFTD
jgi:hypothetical protein